jgi:hypothetical protein
MAATPKLTPPSACLPRASDPILVPLLEAPGEEAARHRLGELLEDVHAGVLLSLAPP